MPRSLLQARSLTETVTGPSIEWLHIHPQARLCVGDALLDNVSRAACHTCFKCFTYRNRLREPSDPTDMACQYCTKRIAYDDWGLWCNTCDVFGCKMCVDLGRVSHRHAMVWTMVVRKNLDFRNNNSMFNTQRSCDRCKQNYMGAIFQGFECTVCRNYHVCAPCIHKKKLPQHMKCRGRDATYELQLIRD